MTKIEAVLFDMDGVLIDAREWHYEALNRALSLFGMEISRYDHLQTYDGLPTIKKLDMLTAERGFPRGLHDFINRMKQIYTMEIVHAKCKPVFHHQYALSRLRADGLKLAVCSNSIRDTVELMLETAKLREYLDVVLSNQDVSRPKPDPAIYLSAMEMLGMKPAQCLVIEDNEHGVKAALASGAHLMRVRATTEVNYQNIRRALSAVEKGVNA